MTPVLYHPTHFRGWRAQSRPSSTGCNDAGDPSVASHPSEGRGPAGLNGPSGKADIRLQVIKEFLDGHRVLRSGLAQATLLDRNVVRIPELPTTVWRVGDACSTGRPKSERMSMAALAHTIPPPTFSGWAMTTTIAFVQDMAWIRF